MKNEEHREQCALFKWMSYHSIFDCTFAIPNGGHRDIRVAVKLKSEGVKSGIPDIFIPIARGKVHGLFIEMKSKKGRASEKQNLMIGRLKEKGYEVKICFGFDDAKKTIEEYLSHE